jgi:ABC-type lipoprotein export system ATPase subunit
LVEWANEHGSALVVATHDPEIAAKMDVTWSIDRGQLVEGAK